MITSEEQAGIDAARIDLRTAGYCVICNRIVERDAEGVCPSGHDADFISGRIVLGPSEQPPALPRFNLAAFLVPPVWGPAHGQWAGAVFLPLWLFMDSVVASAEDRGVALGLGAAFVVVATFSLQAWFATRADGLGWRRVADRMSVDAYLKRERTWLSAMIPLAALLYGWGLYFRFVLAS